MSEESTTVEAGYALQCLRLLICTAAMSEESTTVEAGYALQCLRLLICTAAMSEESTTVRPVMPETDVSAVIGWR